jgi:peptide/nickel transport system permease protein
VTVFIIRRLGQGIVVLIGVSVIVFTLIHLLPGGAARAILGPRALPSELSAFNHANGLDKPLWVQYVTYVNQLVHGNLGFSYKQNQSVASLLAADLPKSTLLVGISVLVALVIAIPVGLFQAVRRNRIADYAITGVSFVAYSMPTFWLGILLILFFSVQLGFFPSEGPQGSTVASVLSDPRALVLPVATLAAVTVAWFSRFMRASAIDSLVQDYIKTARAQGIAEWRILYRHVLRNSLLPIITLLGLSLPLILSGAVMTESVFNYPGMGLLFWNAAVDHDYPILLGFTIVVAAATILGSFLADVLYAVADPRIRYS